jgi:hypothetical protein
MKELFLFFPFCTFISCLLLSAAKSFSNGKALYVKRQFIEPIFGRLQRVLRPHMIKLQQLVRRQTKIEHYLNLHKKKITLALFLALFLAGSTGNSTTTAITAFPVETHRPSLREPFLFLHVPGSGGVAWRKVIHENAIGSKFLPCYSGLPCAINTDREFNQSQISLRRFTSDLTIIQREMRCASIISGHFKYTLIRVLETLDKVEPLNTCSARWLNGIPTVNIFVSEEDEFLYLRRHESF